MAELTEDYLVEQAAVNWLKKSLGYSYIHGSQLSPENEERESYRQVILKKRFIEAIKKLNPWLNETLALQVYKKVTDIDHPDFIIKSKLFHEMLTVGVKVTVREKGQEQTRLAKLINFGEPENNDFLAANQFTVEYQYQSGEFRRPDLVVFINGLPLAVFEFKSFNADETAKDAFYDHELKKQDIPQLYVYAQILGISDGLETKYASKTSGWDRYFVWEGIFSDDDLEIKEIEEERRYYVSRSAKEEMSSLEVLLKGLFRREHLLEYLQDFTLYEKSGESYDNKIAMYHQFYVVRNAVKRTLNAVLKGKTPEQKRIGVVWHTQGTGKSLTMLFYARNALKAKELENPLLLFLTDRNNLDEQLHGVFADMPIVKRAESIKDLQEAIRTTAGGIIFATIQKFGKKKSEEYPLLTKRENIIVIADEAHRSQYREFAQSLRKAIPNASFMGFTATPIELADRSTTLVFGEHVSVYSMDKARKHGVVVPIYYEPRLSKLHLTNEFIDEQFEELSEDMAKDPNVKEALKKRYARLEKLVMAEERLSKVAEDIVQHFNMRVSEFKGKALVVTISRKVAVKLYEKIKEKPKAPSTIVIMSGSRKDPKEYWPHIRDKHSLTKAEDDFKNPDTDPQIAIVVDMWLTGFDVPCLHTMYFDKPMKDHSLVQAITRVNRVFEDKPGGLIVDYIGIADDLRKSLGRYTKETIGQTLINIEELITELKERHDIVASLLHGIDYKNWEKLPPEKVQMLIALGYDKVSKSQETKKQFVKNVVALKKLYALASPHPEATEIKSELRFFEIVKKTILKYGAAKLRDLSRDLEYEMSRLISRSIAAEEPVDVFALMGKDKADVSIFDEKFLAQFKDMEFKNYGADMLAKILRDELRVRMRMNPFRYRSLQEMLHKLIDKYNVKLLDTVEVIDQLIEIAHEIKKASEEGKELKLSQDELAFYDLIAARDGWFENYTAMEEVAREIVKEMGYYVKVADWNRKDYIKAKIRAALKNVLMRAIDGRATYQDIEKLSLEVMGHAEEVYVTV